MEFGRKWSEDKTERKTQGAVAAVEYNPADSCAAVRVDIVIGNRLGDISNSLLVAEIKEKPFQRLQNRFKKNTRIVINRF